MEKRGGKWVDGDQGRNGASIGRLGERDRERMGDIVQLKGLNGAKEKGRSDWKVG
jgi:hypothetical protein